VVTFFKIRGDEAFLNLTLADIGVPPFDIVMARNGTRAIGFELMGDSAQVLGSLPMRNDIGGSA
jgi:hypothetical protein